VAVLVICGSKVEMRLIFAYSNLKLFFSSVIHFLGVVFSFVVRFSIVRRSLDLLRQFVNSLTQCHIKITI